MTKAHSDYLRFLVKKPVHFLSLGFGSGLSPKAPGTCGTLAGIPLLLLVWQLSLSSAIILIVGAFAFGTWCTGETAKALQVDDPAAIVWDEIVGILVAGLPVVILGLPLDGIQGFVHLVVIVGLFRFFDILKPFPINWADRTFHGGFGIMFDDFLAALLANLTYLVFLFFLV